MQHDDDTPIPPPPRLPSSTEPHPGHTGPPEAESPELKAILAVHEEVRALHSMMAKFFQHEQEQDKRLKNLEHAGMNGG